LFSAYIIAVDIVVLPTALVTPPITILGIFIDYYTKIFYFNLLKLLVSAIKEIYRTERLAIDL